MNFKILEANRVGGSSPVELKAPCVLINIIPEAMEQNTKTFEHQKDYPQ